MSHSPKELLGEILRGEHAASESYVQALAGIASVVRQTELKRIKSDHENAIRTLKENLNVETYTNVKGSGSWGLVTESLIGAAKLISDDATLSALRRGEEHGLALYQKVKDSDLPFNIKELIEKKFIPQQNEHVRTLKNLQSVH